MKSKTVLFFAVTFLLMSCGSNNSTNTSNQNEAGPISHANSEAPVMKKYPVKNGTIHFESHMKSGSFEMINKTIVYFDDYGMKERKDTYDEDGSLKESFFSDGKTLYTLIHQDKNVFKAGKAYRGTEMKFDWAEISAADKESGKAKKGTNETILGKDCEVYFYEGSKFAGWKNICLLTEVETGDIRNKTIATNFQEGPVSAELFIVPADYRVAN